MKESNAKNKEEKEKGRNILKKRKKEGRKKNQRKLEMWRKERNMCKRKRKRD